MSGPMLQLGLAGFGRLARRYYVPAFRALNDITLAVVVDPLEASRDAARAAFPSVAALSDPSAFSVRQLDGIIVASPPSTHLALWNLAARAGLPVLLEKPFVLRGELAQAASGHQERRLLMLDLNRRFWPPYRKVRESVRSGLLGDLESMEILLHVDVRPWCSVTSHRLLVSEGGALYDLGSQAIDLACWITGMEPLALSTRGESHRWENDHVLIELWFNGGVQARCDLAYDERAVERLTVEGRRGRIRLFDPNMTVHLGSREDPRRSPWGCARDLATLCYRALRRSRSMVRYTVATALANFTNSIRNGLPFSPGFEDAVVNARWLDAAARSMTLGVSVGMDVPLNPSSDNG